MSDAFQEPISLRNYFAVHTAHDVTDKVARMTHSEITRLTGRAVPDSLRNPIDYLRVIAEARAQLRFIEADAMLKVSAK